MVLTELGIITDSNDVQCQNAQLAILLTESGITTDFNDSQETNAYSLIDVIGPSFALIPIYMINHQFVQNHIWKET